MSYTDKEIETQKFELLITPKGDLKFWRIDWFGNLDYYDKHGERRSSPLVEIFQSSSDQLPSDMELNNKEATRYRNQRRIQVPIGYLTILRIGHIWQKGTLVHTPSYQECTISDCFISQETTKSVLASDKTSQGNYLLPYSHFPYHRSRLQTSCEVLEKLDGSQIIFPHWVILQAYFSKCSFVFSEIFRFGLEFNVIFNESRSSINEGQGVIHLRKSVLDRAGEEVARIAWDKTARSAVSKVSTGLSKNQINNKPLTPETKFPFTAKTTMKLKGKYIPNGDSPENFIVYEIKSCTAPFPFESLKVERDNPGKRNKNEDEDDNYSQKKPGGSNSESPKKPDKLDPDVEPNKNLRAHEFMINIGISYNDLDKKEIFYLALEGNKDSDSEYGDTGGEVELNGNTGEGRHDGSGVPVYFSADEDKNSKKGKKSKKDKYIFYFPICRLNIFHDALNELFRDGVIKDLKFEVVNSRELPYSTFPISLTLTRSEKKWRYIELPNKNENFDGILRRCLIAKFIYNDYLCYFFEAERRLVSSESKPGWVELDSMSILLVYSSSKEIPLVSDNFLEILESASDNNGNWSKHDRLKDALSPLGFNYVTVKHPHNEKAGNRDKHIRLLKNKIFSIKTINTELKDKKKTKRDDYVL